MKMRDVFGYKLLELGEKNKSVVVLDADLKQSTRTLYFAEKFPNRFFQIGVAEQNMFSIAAGMATLGLIPFPTTFAVFATKKAHDQISLGIAETKSNVKIAGLYVGVQAGKGGSSHCEIQDIAVMRSMPNFRVICPGDAIELRAVMDGIIEYYGPVYFRVPREELPNLFDESYQFEWGRAIKLREGVDISLIGTGFMTYNLLIAAKELCKDSIEAQVLHMPCIKPLDKNAIINASKKTGAIVTAENHTILGGLGSAVAEVLSENHPCVMRRIGILDTYIETGSRDELIKKYKLSVEDVIKAAKEVIKKKE